MITRGQHATAQRAAGGDQVDPGHRVAVGGVGLFHQRHEIVEVRGPFGVYEHAAGLHRHQIDGGIGDHSCKAHAAGGGPKRFGVITQRHVTARAIGQGEAEATYMLTPRAISVMVLAMDVGGNGSTNGYLARSGRHGHEETQRHQRAHQLVETDPRTCRDLGASGIEHDRRRHRRHVEQHPSRVLRGVSIRTSETASQHATGSGFANRGGNGGSVGEANDIG